MNPPPPPPPHGNDEVPKGSGLPPGKYDIFIIPPHSSGSGFLYLPSLNVQKNSFIAGFASACAVMAVGSLILPALQQWWYTVRSSGGFVFLMMLLAIGMGAWSLGRSQTEGPGPGGGAGASQSTGGGASYQTNNHTTGQGTSGGSSGGPSGAGAAPKPSWQRTTPGAGTAGANTANSTWEKAREETRRKEAERKAAEALKRAKEEAEKRLKEAREKDAREREEREKKEKEKAAGAETKGSTYAFSAVGEKTNPWPRGTPAAAAAAAAARSQPSSPTKRPPAPTAKTYLGTEDDAYSFRPYDKPNKPNHKKSASSIYSEESYAASHSTSRTTPPPSNRGPYSTKDPDKIVIKAVYAFTNAFLKSPTSQLVSGMGSVTDGLILRITTEGLFIDDDVRGVPQREWDVKAWTMKLVEVWCPAFHEKKKMSSSDKSTTTTPTKPVRRLQKQNKINTAASAAEIDTTLSELLSTCTASCYLFPFRPVKNQHTSDSGSPLKIQLPNSNVSPNQNSQTGESKSANLHVLRASIRDQEGKRYVFVINAEESWKVATGLQRLRRGTQVRALGVSSMTSADARGTLEGLGWA